MYIWYAISRPLINITDEELTRFRIFTRRVYSKVINSSSSSSSLRCYVLIIGLERWVDSYIKYVPVYRCHICFIQGLFKVGLLPRGNLSQVSFAYNMYKRTDAQGLNLCAGFKQTYCRPVTVEFMGVWFVQLY